MTFLKLTPFLLLAFFGLAACENTSSSGGKGPKVGVGGGDTWTYADGGYGGIKPGGEVPPGSDAATSKSDVPADGKPIEHCTNGKDDDGDGQVDCGDSDCLGDIGCGHEKETACTNGKDDDEDTFIDCADYDCKPTAACNGKEDCKNGLDDDGDKFIDCNDNDCLSDAKCLESFEICNNAIDDDKDGFADCADSECKQSPKCATKTENCTNFADDDGDGLADCKDPDCKGQAACGGGGGLKENCTNFADDDGDGLADCKDPDCKTNPACGGSQGGGSGCCTPSAGPGCAADKAVESCVCGTDAFCCDTQWDSQCVSEAGSCGAKCDGGGGGGELCGNGKDDDFDFATDCEDSDCASSPGCGAGGGGACCEPSDGPGCADAAVESCVCGQDPFCCDTQWDGQCVSEAGQCGADCSGGGPAAEDCGNGIDDDMDGAVDCEDSQCAGAPECGTSGGGACCESSSEPGCSDAAVESCVCADDPFCCNNTWDNQCVSEADACGGCNGGGGAPPAAEICGNGLDDDGDGAADCDDLDCETSPSCAPPPGGGGSCCEPSSAPGCSDATVEACVCAQDSFCCNNAWDDLCVGKVPKCGGACGGGAPPAPEVCGNGLDDDGNGAIDCADVHCATTPACAAPAGGACCAATSSPGCAGSAAIEACVCGMDAFCCNNSWDSICVGEVDQCGGSCDGGGAAPADACCATSGSPGCVESPAIEACVCTDDAYCCDVQWDSICVGEAETCGSVCQ